jgi:hypothetical protein
MRLKLQKTIDYLMLRIMQDPLSFDKAQNAGPHEAAGANIDDPEAWSNEAEVEHLCRHPE